MSKEANISAGIVFEQLPLDGQQDDLNNVFDKLWHQWKFILSLVVVAGSLIFAGLLTDLVIDPPAKRYSVIVQFNFPGAENGIYPAGQPFSYNDLVNTRVLTEVYQGIQLQAQNIEFDKFVRSIAVNPVAENAEIIEEKYQSMLTNKKLSSAEIEAMEQSYLQELNAAQARFVRISFIDSQLIGLDQNQIRQILRDIPRVWSQQAITQQGVLDLKIAGADFFQSQILDRFEYLQSMDYLKDSAGYLMQAVNNLVADRVGGQVSNQVSGKTGYDLKVQLQRLVEYEIEPLFDSVISMGITRDLNQALVYMDNTIQNLQDKKRVLASKAVNIERTIAQYAQTGFNSGESEQTLSAVPLNRLDSDFIGKITDLIEDKNDQLFKQQLLNQRLKLLQDMETLDGEIIKFERAQDRLLKSEQVIADDMRTDLIADIELTRNNFKSLLSDYEQLLAARNQKVLGSSSKSLYELTSNDLLEEANLMPRLMMVVVNSVLSGFVLLSIAVLIALFRRPRAVPES